MIETHYASPEPGADDPAPPATATGALPAHEKDPPKPLHAGWTNRLPHWMMQLYEWGDGKLSRLRHRVVLAMPEEIDNHSSQVTGALHIAAEFMMFKASAKEPMVREGGNLLHYIIDPPRRVFGEIFEVTKSRRTGEKIFQGNPVKNIYHRLVNTQEATEREVPALDGKLPNRWQARSTLIGLVAWTLNTIMPDVKDTQAEVDRMAEKAQMHPWAYAAERMKEALWIPGWPDHKRQMTGLGIMLSGTCSMLGAWRNREMVEEAGKIIKATGEIAAKNKYAYTFNASYLVTGMITFLSSIPMIFQIDNERGYKQSGAIHLLRILFMPTSVYQKAMDREPGWKWYVAGTTGFHLQNITASLIGGAEKHDGVVVDHRAMQHEAELKARETKLQTKLGKGHHAAPLPKGINDNEHHKDPHTPQLPAVNDNEHAMPRVPSTVIQSAHAAQKAMPQLALAEAEVS